MCAESLIKYYINTIFLQPFIILIVLGTEKIKK